jgi:uncharacterized protein (DUF2164 family)
MPNGVGIKESPPQLGNTPLDILYKRIYEEGRNINDLSVEWDALTREQKFDAALFLRKMGTAEEMQIEQKRKPEIDFEPYTFLRQEKEKQGKIPHAPRAELVSVEAKPYKKTFAGTPLEEIENLVNEIPHSANEIVPQDSFIEGRRAPRYKRESIGKRGLIETAGAMTQADYGKYLPFSEEVGAIVGELVNQRGEVEEAMRFLGQYKKGVHFPAKRYENATFKNADEEARAARRTVTEYFENLEDVMARGETFWADKWSTILTSAKWMAEFLFTGGLADVVGAGTKQIAEGIAKRYLPKLVAGAVTTTAVLGTRAAIRQPFFAGRIADDYMRRISPSYNVDANGRIVLTKEGEGVGSALFRSILQSYISTITEETGEYVVGGVGKGLGYVAHIPGISKIVSKIKPLVTKTGEITVLREIVKFLKRPIIKSASAGSLIEELSEERSEDVLQAIFNTQDMGFTEEEKNTVLNRLRKAVSDWSLKRFLGEIVTFAPFIALGGAGRAISKEQLLTPEGARDLALRDSERAKEFAERPEPSRGSLRKVLGVAEDTSLKEREQIQTNLKQAIEEVQKMSPEEKAALIAPPEAVAPELAPAPSVERVAPIETMPPIQEVKPEITPAETAARAEALIPPEAVAPVAEKIKGRKAEIAPPVEARPPAPEVTPEAEKAWFVSKEEKDAATERIKTYFQEHRMSVGLPTELMGDFAKIGLYHFEQGVRKFRTWSAEMIDRLTEGLSPELKETRIGWLKPQLRNIWKMNQEAHQNLLEAEKQEARLVKRYPQTAKKVIAKRLIEWKKGEAQKLTPAALLKLALTKEKKGVKGGIVLGKLYAEAEAEAKEFVKSHPELTGARQAIEKTILKQKEGEPVINTPAQLLKWSMQRQVRAAAKGYRAGQLDRRATQQEIIQFAHDKLPVEFPHIAKVMERVAVMKTQKSARAKIVDAINLMTQKYEKQSLITEVKGLLRESKDPRLRPEFQGRLNDLLSGFQLKMPLEKTLKRYKSMLAFAERSPMEVPQILIDKAKERLSDTGKPYIRDLAPEDLRGIITTIQSLIHQSAEKNKLLAGRAEESYETKVKAIVAEVEKISQSEKTKAGVYVEPKKAGLISAPKKIVHALIYDQKNYKNTIRKVAPKNGALYDALWTKVFGGERTSAGLTRRIKTFFDNLATKAEYKELLHSVVRVELPTAVDSKGERVTEMQVTPNEIMEQFLDVQDSSTQRELWRKKQEGFTFSRDPHKLPVKLYPQDFAALIQHLTPRQTEIAYKLRNFINRDMRAELDPVWVKEYNYDLPRRADYFHRQREGEYRKVEPNKVQAYWIERYAHDMGIFKDRHISNAPFVIEGAIENTRRQAIRMAIYTAKELPTMNALTILQDHRVREAIRNSTPEGTEIIRKLEDFVRSWQGLDFMPTNKLDSAIREITRTIQTGILVLRLPTLVMQPISYVNLLVSGHIEAKHVTAALSDLKNIPALIKNVDAEISQWSDLLYNRETSTGNELITPGTSRTSLETYLGIEGPLAKTQNVSMNLYQKGDNFATRLTWQAAKRQGVAKGLTGDTLMKYTAETAEEAVADTQSTWDPLTISTLHNLSLKNPWMKPFLVFTSAISKNLNVALEGVTEWRQSGKTVNDYVRLAGKIIVPTLGNALMVYAIREGLGVLISGRKHKKPEEHIWGLARELGSNVPAAGPFISQFIYRTEKALAGVAPAMITTRGNIWETTIDTIIKAATELTQAISQAINDEYYKQGPQKYETKWEDTAKRAIEDIAKSTGYCLGLPVESVLQSFERLTKERLTPDVQQFNDRWRELQQAYDSAKRQLALKRKPISPDLAREYHKFSHIADRMSNIRNKVKDEGMRLKLLTGTARAALGKEKLSEYPTTGDLSPEERKKVFLPIKENK